MGQVFEQNAVYLQSGDPTKEDTPTLMQPGTLGARFSLDYPTSRASAAAPPRRRRYQIVQVDPAAAAVPKSGGPAYWVDRSKYTVTGVGGTLLNQVAGVFNNAPAKGNYTCIQIGGPCLVRASDANVTAAVAGADVLAGGATDLGVLVASGTAPGTKPLGVVSSPKVTDTTGGTGNQKVQVDLDLGETL
jgi:hypothetical protein